MPIFDQTDVDLAWKVYEHMFRTGSSDVPNAAEALGLKAVKRERAMEVLSTLRLLDGERIHRSDALLTPDAALRRLLSDEMDTLESAARRVRETQAAVSTLVQEFLPMNMGPSDDVRVELVRDSGRIRGLLTEITDRAVSEVVSVHPGPPPPEEILRSGLERDEIMLRRGIRLRALYQDQFLRVGYARQYLNSLRRIGVDVRTNPVVPARMIICDTTLALLAAVGEQEQPPVLVLRGETIVQPITQLYDLAWNPGNALPHDEGLPRPPLNQLAPQHAALLQMLAAGLKDEKIARNLGVSPRTLSRLIRELMDALGAQSRFQGGVRAQEFHWLG